MSRWPLSCVLAVVLTFGSDKIGAQLDYDLRLVDGSNSREGRVEVYYGGIWSTTCHTSFGVKEALVVCRQLGFPDALPVPIVFADLGAGSEPGHMNKFSCQGDETNIKQCESKQPNGVNGCYPAGVICMPPTADAGFGLRLVGGPNENTGRVEVSHNGYWGTICNDTIGANEVKIICRQLGYVDGTIIIAGPGEGSGPIWMDNVVCRGTESNVASCSFDGWGEHDCVHTDDIWVRCNEARNIRLVDGSDSRSGRLEVFYNGTWGTVCDDGFSNASASVVCMMLFGLPSGVALKEAAFEMGSGPIWLDQVECNGDEMSMFTCQQNRFGLHDCVHGEDVGVQCSSPVSSLILTGDNNLEPIIRLANGTGYSNGRLEVLHDGVWGTVCKDYFSDTEATVACRMLGYSSGVAVSEAAFGEGSDPIWLDNVNCTGTEMTIFECQHNELGIHNCDHTEDVGVICSIVNEKECFPNNRILVRGLPFGTSAGFAVNEDGDLCTVGPFVLNTVNYHVAVNITGCEKDKAIVFTYGPNAVTQEHFVQSKESGVFKVVCKEITDTKFNVTGSIQVDVNATNKFFNDVTYDVVSEIYPSTNLFVGDQVTWSISYPVQYKLQVTTCTANPGLEYNDLNKVLLVNDACSQDLELIVDEFTASTGNTSAKLRVFKFSENDFVFLHCKLLLCPHTSTSCRTSCILNGQKKKRGTAVAGKYLEGIREVSNVLRIMESYNNGAPSCSYFGLTLLLILITRL